MDGKATSGERWSGPIGRIISGDVVSLPLKNDFQPVKECNMHEIPTEVVKNLTGDQAYLYKIFKVIESGQFPSDFEKYEVLGH